MPTKEEIYAAQEAHVAELIAKKPQPPVLPAVEMLKTIDAMTRVTRREAIELTDGILEELQRPKLRLAVLRAYAKSIAEYLKSGEKAGCCRVSAPVRRKTR
jgi:hypothetical protein